MKNDWQIIKSIKNGQVIKEKNMPGVGLLLLEAGVSIVLGALSTEINHSKQEFQSKSI